MATRNLTQKFESLRQQIRSRRPSSRRDGALLGDGVDSTDVVVNIGHSLPPAWVDIVEDIQKEQARAKENIKLLQQMHADRLKVTFGDDAETKKERDIDILTQEVTRGLKKAENSLKRIALIGNQRGSVLSQEERIVRLNVMRALGVELQSISKSFRHCQKDFLMRLKGQEDFGSNAVFGDDTDAKQPLSFDEAMERGFTPAQVARMAQMQQTASDREKEILRIAQSVNDLAAVFKELNVLIIEQGTVLDRIDYNIEQTLVKVKAGVKELQEADKISRKARSLKCMGVLLFIIIVLSIILGVKNNNN